MLSNSKNSELNELTPEQIFSRQRYLEEKIPYFYIKFMIKKTQKINPIKYLAAKKMLSQMKVDLNTKVRKHIKTITREQYIKNFPEIIKDLPDGKYAIQGIMDRRLVPFMTFAKFVHKFSKKIENIHKQNNKTYFKLEKTNIEEMNDYPLEKKKIEWIKKNINGLTLPSYIVNFR